MGEFEEEDFELRVTLGQRSGVSRLDVGQVLEFADEGLGHRVALVQRSSVSMFHLGQTASKPGVLVEDGGQTRHAAT